MFFQVTLPHRTSFVQNKFCILDLFAPNHFLVCVPKYEQRLSGNKSVRIYWAPGFCSTRTKTKDNDPIIYPDVGRFSEMIAASNKEKKDMVQRKDGPKVTSVRRIKSDANCSARKSRKQGDSQISAKGSTRDPSTKDTSPLQIIGKKFLRRNRTASVNDTEKLKEESDLKDQLGYDIQSIFGGMTGEPLIQWASRIERMGVSGLKKEFLELKKQMPSHPAEVWERNTQKNHVPCFDYNRVRLEGCSSGDYIHANYVDGYNRTKQFICSQGPLDTTLEDFWRMIWEQKCVVVIMLTRFVEMQKAKCAIYFAEDEGQETEVGEFLIRTGPVTVDPISETEKVICRDLLVSYKGNQRQIKHLLYAEWPDRGTPPSAAQFICILAIIHQYQVKQAEDNKLKATKVPILVHCSAGIGRTGTLVAVDVCREHLRRTKRVDVEEVVRRLREQRAFSVQTDSQYIFVHRAIIEWSIMMHRIGFNYETFYAQP